MKPNHGEGIIARYLMHDNIQETIKEIFESYYKELCNYATKELQPDAEAAAEAENVVMDLLFKLLNNPGYLKNCNNLENYLFTSAKNACISRNTNLPKKRLHDKQFLYCLELQDDGPDTRAMHDRVLTIALQHMETMPKKRRVIIKMIFVDDMGTAQIAEQLGISQHTVRVQKGRFLKSLKDVLRKKEM
jgi:RNA polymerase sigma factor (sigma-70 family)